MDQAGGGASGQKRPLAQISAHAGGMRSGGALPPSSAPVLPSLPPPLPLHGVVPAAAPPPLPVGALLPPVDLSRPLPEWMRYTAADTPSTEPPGSDCAVPLLSPGALARARATLPENRLLMEAMVTTARLSVGTDRPAHPAAAQPLPPQATSVGGVAGGAAGVPLASGAPLAPPAAAATTYPTPLMPASAPGVASGAGVGAAPQQHWR